MKFTSTMALWMFSMITIVLCFLNLSILRSLFFFGIPGHRTAKLWLAENTVPPPPSRWQKHHQPPGAPPEAGTRDKKNPLSLKGTFRWRADVVWGLRQSGKWIYFNMSQITQENVFCQLNSSLIQFPQKKEKKHSGSPNSRAGQKEKKYPKTGEVCIEGRFSPSGSLLRRDGKTPSLLLTQVD